MRTIDEILDGIIERHGLKNHSALAKFLGVRHSVVSTWRARQTIPYDVLLRYCVNNNLDLIFLLTGIITAERGEEEGKPIGLISSSGPGLYIKDTGYAKLKREIINKDTETSHEYGTTRSAEGVGEKPPHVYGSEKGELRDLVDALVEIMVSDDEITKEAIKGNLIAFRNAIRAGKKVSELENDNRVLKAALHPYDPGTDVEEG
ncbi:MAG: helix-turn-helix domain containing protein [Syntrophobacterales bacterium]|jgi:hypothetical protein|nr:helix-turn-helix domain containing protein [Syntrophobacterales bacterium]